LHQCHVDIVINGYPKLKDMVVLNWSYKVMEKIVDDKWNVGTKCLNTTLNMKGCNLDGHQMSH
jgi:hypothetical protein